MTSVSANASPGHVRVSTEDESVRLTVSGQNDSDFVKLWSVWPGNNRFLFDGRIITGPERGAVWGTAVLVLIPLVLFFTRIVPPLLAYDPSAWWAPLCAVAGFSSILISLVRAHAT